jgi:hypothetical protein
MNKNLLLSLGLAALALCFLAPGSASAVTINFIELPNEAGIQVTGIDANGNPFSTSKPNSEQFYISSPAVPTGYVPDLILSHIGISQTSSGYLFVLLESAGGPVSDYIWVHRLNSIFTVIDFISDTENFLVPPSVPTTTVVETGGLQFVGAYLNDKGEQVQFNVQSDRDVSVPDSGVTIVLFGSALGVMAAVRRKLGVA